MPTNHVLFLYLPSEVASIFYYNVVIFWENEVVASHWMHLPPTHPPPAPQI